ncbi:MAG: hypothetical protein ACK4QL_04320 [Pseudanabaenaceae cyanobacterium]
MAESTLQYEWIVLIKEDLERFTAGDLLWYLHPTVPRDDGSL